MGTRGGTRPGAGRKKGSLSQSTKDAIIFKQYMLERILEEKKPIIDALLKAAKNNNIPAIREILDRTLGRPEQMIDLTTGGKKIGVEIKNIDLSKMDYKELLNVLNKLPDNKK